MWFELTQLRLQNGLIQCLVLVLVVLVPIAATSKWKYSLQEILHTLNSLKSTHKENYFSPCWSISSTHKFLVNLRISPDKYFWFPKDNHTLGPARCNNLHAQPILQGRLYYDWRQGSLWAYGNESYHVILRGICTPPWYSSRDVPRSIFKVSRDVPKSMFKVSRDVPRSIFKVSRDVPRSIFKDSRDGSYW
jgi:hypothetical protein